MYDILKPTISYEKCLRGGEGSPWFFQRGADPKGVRAKKSNAYGRS